MVQHVVCDDFLNNDIRRKSERFDQSIDERLSDQNFMAGGHDGFYIQDELTDTPTDIARPEEDVHMSTFDTLEADDINNVIIDKYLNAELIFDVGTDSE